VGQPIQRGLKMAWAHAGDLSDELAAKKNKKPSFQDKIHKKDKAKTPPRQAALVAAYAELEGDLGPFITGLSIEGFLGDALGKADVATLLPLLHRFALVYTDAVVEAATLDPSARLDDEEKARLKKDGATAEEKSELFSRWRDFSFEDSIAAATKRGVRYAGMGNNHLLHLIEVGLASGQHAFDMQGDAIDGFRTRTKELRKKAKK
jgi:hypothetical protein